MLQQPGSHSACMPRPSCSTAINASQMITGMIINLVIGLACYAGFVLWRGKWVLGAGGAGCWLPVAAPLVLLHPCLLQLLLPA